MSVTSDVKAFLQGLTYTKSDGTEGTVNVFTEEDVISRRKLDFPTPAFIIRDTLSLETQGITMIEQRVEVTVSLYLTVRAQEYDPVAVKEELTDKVREGLLTSDIGDSAWVGSYRDLDWLEGNGVFRRDFTIIVFKMR